MHDGWRRAALVFALGLGLAAVLLVMIAGCKQGTVPADPQRDAGDVEFDRAAMLVHTVADFLVPTYDEFHRDAADLVSALEARCASLASGTQDETQVVAQDAWRAAIDTWERAEAVLIGPAAMDDRALRDRVYAWPLMSSCGVDQDVVKRWNQPADYDVAVRLNNVRSLAAIEYLLFSTATTNTCPVGLPGWDSLGSDLPRARCELALAIATDVAAQADLLWRRWDPAGEDYGRQLAAAGTSESSIPSLREAVNQLSDSLFYLDAIVKDMKLGEAAGIADNSCGTVQTPCEREVEHRYADHATAAIRINLRATQAVFSGTMEDVEGLGFEDYLRAVGADDVADVMTATLDQAIAAADALPERFLVALESDYDTVVSTYTEVKAFTDELKTRFLTVLSLDIPDDAAGDND